MIIDQQPPSPKTQDDFDSEQQWWDYLGAVSIMRRASLVEFTGWTFEELDRQPREEVAKLETYLRIKAGVQKQHHATEQARAKAQTRR